MSDHLTLLVLVVALAVGMITAFLTAVLARSRQTAFFRYFLANILLFNLLVLAGLVFRYLVNGSALHPAVMFALMACMAVLKISWVWVFTLMTLAMPGDSTRAATARNLGVAAVILLALYLVLMPAGVAIRAFELIILGSAAAAALRLLMVSGKVPTAVRRRALRLFGGLHTALFAAVMAIFVFSWFGHDGGSKVAVLVNSGLLVLYNLLPLWWVFLFQPAGAGGRAKGISRYGITPRETEIIDLICDGHTNREIAERLYISPATVKDHNYNIFRKTGVRNRVELANLFR